MSHKLISIMNIQVKMWILCYINALNVVKLHHVKHSSMNILIFDTKELGKSTSLQSPRTQSPNDTLSDHESVSITQRKLETIELCSNNTDPSTLSSTLSPATSSTTVAAISPPTSQTIPPTSLSETKSKHYQSQPRPYHQAQKLPNYNYYSNSTVKQQCLFCDYTSSDSTKLAEHYVQHGIRQLQLPNMHKVKKLHGNNTALLGNNYLPANPLASVDDLTTSLNILMKFTNWKSVKSYTLLNNSLHIQLEVNTLTFGQNLSHLLDFIHLYHYTINDNVDVIIPLEKFIFIKHSWTIFHSTIQLFFEKIFFLPVNNITSFSFIEFQLFSLSLSVSVYIGELCNY
ncbi:homeobox protein Meis3-like 1 [Schistosoma japonicum]|nr:homeobox protein Meis3-like 1 [Schistosoma japonicum]